MKMNRFASFYRPSMKTKMSRVLAVLLFCALASRNWANAHNNNVPTTVSLCEVLAHPTDYSGTKITMTVRIVGTKEGSFVWSPRCRDLGRPLLQVEDQSKPESGVKLLLDMLRSHGLSDHPVVATLTGVFTYEQLGMPSNRHKAVFKVSAASDIKLSDSD